MVESVLEIKLYQQVEFRLNFIASTHFCLKTLRQICSPCCCTIHFQRNENLWFLSFCLISRVTSVIWTSSSILQCCLCTIFSLSSICKIQEHWSRSSVENIHHSWIDTSTSHRLQNLQSHKVNSHSVSRHHAELHLCVQFSTPKVAST